MDTPPKKYSRFSIAMHWLMVILIVLVYATIELKGNFPKDSEPRNIMKQLHFMLGLTVLLLALVRLAVRLFITKVPPITPKPSPLVLGSAHLVHVLLYGLMIGLPILGWTLLSAAGKPIPFWGVDLPSLVAANKELVGNVKFWHETLANWGYALIGLHAVAALYHHYWVKDDTLLRMMPKRK